MPCSLHCMHELCTEEHASRHNVQRADDYFFFIHQEHRSQSEREEKRGGGRKKRGGEKKIILGIGRFLFRLHFFVVFTFLAPLRLET